MAYILAISIRDVLNIVKRSTDLKELPWHNYLLRHFVPICFIRQMVRTIIFNNKKKLYFSKTISNLLCQLSTRERQKESAVFSLAATVFMKLRISIFFHAPQPAFSCGCRVFFISMKINKYSSWKRKFLEHNKA